ncbi:glycine betaine/proline transport system substrate-binding protein [Nocardioides albertanoniae]|uniref:Glycine betaine/proline transport system substrate-binding protein n=1 Tax=Nocardioides albertanoniae TaxID=1175486 RepID=A0A543A851_9ACTN|nr:ABC transporter substrate-binding protein [Nocardioides albertanoniae]TQL68775.1 glycine betaine/proline transport system substrate-binding protein [Nocardioides albertanoniae]
MRRAQRLAVAALTMAMTAATVTACTTASERDGFAQSDSGGAENSVVLAEQPWVDLQVENEVAVQVLQELGYEASIKKNLSVENAATAVSSSQIDAYLGNWWPSQKPSFGQAIDDGDIEVLSTIVKGTEYAPAIPGDVAEKLGITSLADLDANGAKFGKKIYGIEAGSPGNETIQKAIDEDAYGLGDWKLVASGTPAMLAQVDKAQKAGQPIVFLGWSPHWMTVEFDAVFLDDPDKVWGGAGEIRTVTRKGYADENPQIAKFLSNLRFTTDEAGEFYYEHDKQGKELSAIAEAWIKDNPDKIEKFLDGVEDADGEKAEI